LGCGGAGLPRERRLRATVGFTSGWAEEEMVHMTAPPLLSLQGIYKRFGAVQALADVELEICSGEIVALLGDTGAGKSTLVKVISGVGPADRGTIMWEGLGVQIKRPRDAQHLGISTLYQELALCDNLDIASNLFLGRERRRPGFLGSLFRLVDTGGMRRETCRQLSALGIRVPDIHTPVASLSGGQRQTVAISRCLLWDPKLVILDEPTAALGLQQSTHVLDLVDGLRENGLGVLFISHNLGDVKAIADRAVVLRLGRNNGLFDVKTASHEQIVSAITGATHNAVTYRKAEEVDVQL
jgi:D-xylose transport system ATP-binding protein